jgi:hypothetical protein
MVPFGALWSVPKHTRPRDRANGPQGADRSEMLGASQMATANRTAPTPKQLSYLAALVERAGMTQDQWRESVGLYESSPWGKRLRTEMITRAAVSRWIDALKARAS